MHSKIAPKAKKKEIKMKLFREIQRQLNGA